jgi:hypothetical protein
MSLGEKAGGRIVNRKITVSKPVNDLSSDTCRLAFTWTITFLDRDGRTTGDPLLLKNTIFPRRKDITDEHMYGFLKEWALRGLITWYEHDGDYFLQFVNWLDNQPKLRYDRERPSSFPAPEDSVIVYEISDYEESTSLRSKSGVNPQNRGVHPPQKEKKQEQEKKVPPSAGGSPSEEKLPVKAKKSNVRKISESTGIPDADGLHSQVVEAFQSKLPGETAWNYGREGKHVKEIIQKATTEFPEDPAGFIKEAMNEFWDMRKEKFYKNKAFLPSIMNSSGVWPEVMQRMANRTGVQQTDEDMMRIYKESLG